jgi:hypothetical protein
VPRHVGNRAISMAGRNRSKPGLTSWASALLLYVSIDGWELAGSSFGRRARKGVEPILPAREHPA